MLSPKEHPKPLITWLILGLATCLSIFPRPVYSANSCRTSLGTAQAKVTELPDEVEHQLILEELAALRTAISNAQKSGDRSVAYTLAKAYSAKLAEADHYQLPLGRFNQTNEKADLIEKEVKKREHVAESIESLLRLLQNTTSFEFSPDGKTGLAQMKDLSVVTVDLASGKIRHVLTSDVDFRRATFSADGKRVILVSDGQPTMIAEVETGVKIGDLGRNGTTFYRAYLNANGTRALVVNLKRFPNMIDEKTNLPKKEFTAGLWDSVTGKLITSFQPALGEVVTAVFTKDESKVITQNSTDSGKGTQVWDAKTGRFLHDIHTNSDSGTLGVSPNGRYAVAINRDGALEIFDMASGELIHSILGHSTWADKLHFDHTGRYLLTSGRDAYAILWDLENGKIVHYLQSGTTPTIFADFLHGTQELVTVDRSNNLYVWNMITGARKKVLDQKAIDPNLTTGMREPSISVSSDGKSIVVVRPPFGGMIWRQDIISDASAR